MKFAKNLILTLLISGLVGILSYLTLVWLFFKIIIFCPLGEEILWNLLIKNDIVLESKNPRIDKMQNLVTKIPPYLLPKNYPKLEILLVKEERVTAYAAAGGRILITTAMLERISDKALFFVICHEISHLTRGDHIYELAKLLAKKYYFLLLRSDVIAELLQLSDQGKLKKNEELSDLYAYKITDIIFNDRRAIEKEIEGLNEKIVNFSSY